MQVIERMPDDEYDALCAQGAKLVEELVKLLERAGMGLDQAPAILSVAAAGIALGLSVKPEEFADMIAKSRMLWRLEQSTKGNGLIFDPPHLRPGFVPVERDTTAGN